MGWSSDAVVLRNTLNARGAAHETHEALTRLASGAKEAEELRAQLATTINQRDLAEHDRARFYNEFQQEREARKEAENGRLEEVGNRISWQERSESHRKRAEALKAEADLRREEAYARVMAVRCLERAERALKRAGFEDRGGEEWVPPVIPAETKIVTFPGEFVSWRELGERARAMPPTGKIVLTAYQASALENDACAMAMMGQRGTSAPVLSARDEFAKAAMQGTIASGADATHGAIARTAYELADAMLKARGG